MAHSFRFLKWNYITTIGASLGLLLLYGIIYLIFHDLAARQTIKRTQANAVAQNKGAARLSEKATQSGTKASIKKSKYPARSCRESQCGSGKSKNKQMDKTCKRTRASRVRACGWMFFRKSCRLL